MTSKTSKTRKPVNVAPLTNDAVASYMSKAFAALAEGFKLQTKANVLATMAVSESIASDRITYADAFNAAGYGKSKEQSKATIDKILEKVGGFDLSDKNARPSSNQRKLLKDACAAVANVFEHWTEGEEIPCALSKTGNLIVPGHALYSDDESDKAFYSPDKADLDAIPVTGSKGEAFTDLLRRANNKFRRADAGAPEDHKVPVKDAAVVVLADQLAGRLAKGRDLKAEEVSAIRGIMEHAAPSVGYAREDDASCIYAVQRMVKDWTRYADNPENGAEIMDALESLYDALDTLFGAEGEVRKVNVA